MKTSKTKRLSAPKATKRHNYSAKLIKGIS